MENFGKNLKNELSKQLSNELGNVVNSNSENVGDFMNSSENLLRTINTNENKQKTKSIKSKKIQKPIGKILTISKGEMIENLLKKNKKQEKNETKEATGSGSGGGFVTVFGGEMKEKWSQKYKDSINCSNPKGFSQRAHCQEKKKQQNEGEFKAPKLTMFSDEAPKKIKKSQITKTETKEATASASAGSYVTPAAWAKSTKKKDWRGKSKTLFPGGKFVQVKKKCKTFPYCNQGDINALNLTNEGKMGKVISKLSEKYNITEDFVRKLIIKEYRKGK